MTIPKGKNILEEIGKYIGTMKEEAIPNLSVNCVIICFHKESLQVVVNRIVVGDTSLLLLPGGYVKHREDLNEAVERIVKESTGMENILFRQFSVFGKASRSFAEEMTEKTGLQTSSDQALLDWLSKRFISLCYIALVDYQKIDLKPTEYFQSARWLPMDDAGMLAMDHVEMLQSAREFLKKEILHTPIAANLLPSRFSLPDLQILMECILNRHIDRPNFRRKILSTGMLEKVGLSSAGKGRPAAIYRFKYGKDTSLAEELRFGF